MKKIIEVLVNVRLIFKKERNENLFFSFISIKVTFYSWHRREKVNEFDPSHQDKQSESDFSCIFRVICMMQSAISLQNK